MEKMPKPMGLYPNSRKVGNLLFLSGIGPRQANTDEIPGLQRDKYGNYTEFNFEAQCHSVFANVKTALEEAGSKWENLIDVTVFLTNMKRDFAIYNKLYAQYFAEVMPCRTTVEVNALPSPIAIELKCIATIE